MLSQDGFNFFGLDHGMIAPEAAFEVALETSKFMGLLGEAHIVDQPKGRDLYCQLFFDGYGSRAALWNDLLTLDSQVGTLVDDLTMIVNSDVSTFPQCTFLGWQGDANGPFYDGSGQNGWVYIVRLHWRQRNRNSAGARP